ncbi:hypothetical protein FRC06_003357 [Ceratobasidium sp. 370]|nr:hypothetical protein FRC06_003357 [Ceratobasidium sp. 370]
MEDTRPEPGSAIKVIFTQSYIIYAGVLKVPAFILVPLMWLQPKMYGISLLHTLNTRPTMAQPTVAFETTYSAPSYTTSNNGLRPAVAPARTAQTERPNFISYNNAVGASEIRSNFTAPIEPLKPTVVSFDTETVAAISGDSPKVDIILVNSHSVSSDMEMVERESKLTDLESRPSTAG